jgi:hypothetical protein
MSYATLSAFGHSRLGEWIFGGLTRELLATTPICGGIQSRDVAWDRSDVLCHAGCLLPGAHEIRV